MNARTGALPALGEAGAALATLSSLAYAAGYLALRGRAYALGIDPGFALVDEAYVFAGFRFVLVTLVSLVVASPVILAAAGLGSVLGWRWKGSEPVALVAAAVLVLAQLQVLSARDLLLGDGRDRWTEAALGRNPAGLFLTLAATALAALLTLWLRARWPGRGGRFAPLAALTLLQLALLPLIHGLLFADRSVRVLDAAPPAAAVLKGPVGLVFRSADRITLVGLNPAGARRLVVVKEEALLGAPVRAVVTLADFVDALDRRSAALSHAMPRRAGGGR